MSQELGITEKDPNFINPYKNVHHIKRPNSAWNDQPEVTKKAKKKKKSFKKGPTLSRNFGDL